MPEPLRDLRVDNDDLVHADHIAAAVTAGTLVYDNGATQVFTADGQTTYTDRGRPSQGNWWALGDGKFISFWPPDYQATYELRWVVEGGAITGLTFIEAEQGTRFDGRYV
jgi:hypothetical protein